MGVFHNVIFPDYISAESEIGPGFMTRIHQSAVGYEERQADRDLGLLTANVGKGLQTADDAALLLTFFRLRLGMWASFRFRDPTDYGIADWQEIAVGNGSLTAFQIKKEYTDGTQTELRDITKPRQGTLQVRVNAVTQTEGVNYNVNYNTGIITFTAAPTAGHSIEVIVQFDVCMRFASDLMKLRLKTEDVVDWPDIELVEVLGE